MARFWRHFLTRAQTSWALYDLAGSIFFANIVAVYFPIYFVTEMGGANSAFIISYALAQLFTGITAIFWGRYGDHTGGYRKLFVIFVILTILATSSLALVYSQAVLVLFLVAFYVYSTTLIFYEALLPSITTRKTLPIVSGIGGGLGLAGSVVALFIAAPFLDEFGIVGVFGITAFTFLAFALPALLWVKPEQRDKIKLHFTLSFKHVYAWARWFLVARVFYSGAAIALIIHTPLMATQLFGFEEHQVRTYYAAVSIAAAIGAVITGFLSKRIKPLYILAVALGFWIILQFIMALWLSTALLYVVVAIGFLAGVTFNADRIFYISHAPRKHLGEYLGFRRLTYLGGGVVIPLVFGGILLLLQDDLMLANQIGLGAIALLLAGSLWMVWLIISRKLQ